MAVRMNTAGILAEPLCPGVHTLMATGFLYRLNLGVWCLCLGDIWIYIGVYHAIVCLSNNVLFGRVSGSDLACSVLYAGFLYRLK